MTEPINPIEKMAAPKKAPAKKSILDPMTILMLALGVSLAANLFVPLVLLRKNIARALPVSADYSQLKTQFDELVRKKDALEADRNNVLAQTKMLLMEKSKYTEAQEQFEELKKSSQAILGQKMKLHEENEKLAAERDDLEEHYRRVQNNYLDLQQKYESTEADIDRLNEQMRKTVESSPAYIKLSAEKNNLIKENKKQSDAIKKLSDDLKKAAERLNKITGRDRQFGKQVQGLNKTVRQLKAENQKLQKVNAALNRQVQEGPKRFKDMAKENRKLVRETAEMHYNMGVFFIKNKEFVLAAREFQRALEFDPGNAKVLYNLGYLYAEQLENHEQAVECFEKYLEISPNSQESEAVRNYMLVHKVYSSKMLSASKV